jgi:hypothetical protein
LEKRGENMKHTTIFLSHLSVFLLVATIFIFHPLTLLAQEITYFPHIASDGTWGTEICIINTSFEQSLSGDLKAYDDSGQSVESKSITLTPNARREIIIGNEFSKPGDIKYIIFESDSESVGGYTKFYIEGKYRVAIPTVKDVNAGDIYISHIASNAGWWTGISILNTTSSSKELTIEFDNGTTKPITVAAKEHRAFTIKSLFGDTPQSDINSAVIKNGSGIVGLELFGSTDNSGDNYLSGILLKDETTTNIYYPHIASDSTWWTGIVAYNPSATSCTLTITPFSAGGISLSPQTIILAGKEKYIGTIQNLNFPEGTAWFKIGATSPVTGFELFGTNDGRQLGGYTGVGISGTDGVFAKIEKNAGWTGIAFVNIENAPAKVHMIAYDDNGRVIAATGLDLNAHEKVVKLAPDLFSKGIWNATYIEYSSDKEVVGFQLNGSSDGFLLDGLPGIRGVGGPQIFNYVIGFNAGDPNPLTCTETMDNETLTIPIISFRGEGTYNTATEETTLNSDSVISVDTTMDMFGELEILITQRVEWISSYNPTEGAFEVHRGSDTIGFSINPDVGGTGGVDIIFESNSVSLTWDAFEDVGDNPAAPEYQKIASFANSTYQYVFDERAKYAFQAFQAVTINVTALETAGSNNVGLTETCDQFPPQSGSSGTREYVWIDADLSGDIGPGDHFSVTYDSNDNGCWYDDPKDNFDDLLKGTLELNNYIKNVDGVDNLISTGADILFNNFVEKETIEGDGGGFTVDPDSFRTDGGFNMFLTPTN